MKVRRSRISKPTLCEVSKMSRPLIQVLIIVCAFQFAFESSAFPQKLPFVNYTTDDGLSQSTVNSILQDKKGYLWFATWSGISRFDGKIFTYYTSEDGLVNNGVLSMLEDNQGDLWFGTYNGVSKLAGDTWTSFTTEDGLPGNDVWAILEDREGNIWIGTQNSGAGKFDGMKWRSITSEDGLVDNWVNTIVEDNKGNLWFGTRNGLSRLAGDTWTNFTTEDGLADNYVLSIMEDSEGNLWFGTENGLSKFDGSSWRTFTTEQGLAHNQVMAIFEDTESNLWFGTWGGGVSRFDGKNWRTFTTENGLAHNRVMAIFQDREGNLWFGTRRGGISKFGGSAFISYTAREGLAENMIYAVLEDQDGNLWFGTWLEGVSRFDGKQWKTFTTKDGLAGNSVLSIFEDRKGDLWFGTEYGGISKFDGKRWKTVSKEDPLVENRVSSIIEDSRGSLWFGTQQGARKLDGEKWRTFATGDGLIGNHVLQIIESSQGDLWFGTTKGVSKFDGISWRSFTAEDGLAGNWVNTIFEDTEGNLWFGTLRGISKFDGSSFFNYTTEDGLSDNTCYFIIQDDNYLYFGTNKGMNRFDGKTFKVYTVRDGLASNEMDSRACIKDRQGNLWFGTIGGATKFNPELDKPNLTPPPVYITRVGLLDKELTIPDGAKLKHSENYLKIDFVGICFSSPEYLIYNYKLEGFDSDWQSSSQRSVQYTNLSSGNYTFKVRARNKDGIWSEEYAKFSFLITPPFWSTWWFRIFSIILLAGVSYLILKEWHKRKLVKELEGKNIELRNTLEHERLLSRIASRLNSADSFQSVVDELLEIICTTMEVDCACFFRFKNNDRAATRLNHNGSKTGNPQNDSCPWSRQFGKGQKLTELIKANESIAISNFSELAREERSRITEDNFKPILITPLALAGRIRGYICCSRQKEHRWNQNEIDLYKTIADVIMGAWERNSQFKALLEAERKRTEAARIAEKASRLASIGVMAGGITHEINQPLNAIKLTSDSILLWIKNKKVGIPQRFIEYLGNISSHVERIDKIIKYMRNFWVTPTRISKDIFDLKEAVNNALSLVESQLHSHGISMELELDSDQLPIRGNHIHLEQVVINLVVNSMNALDETNREDKKIKIITRRSGKNAFLEIQDNGTGFPEKDTSKLFDPFYSTKKSGEGMGLGLAIVKTFVDELGGSSNAANNKTLGATFTVELPLSRTNRGKPR